MVFGYDVPVKFSVEGACKTASVHLTGYFQPGPDDDEEEEDEDEDGKKNLFIPLHPLSKIGDSLS